MHKNACTHVYTLVLTVTSKLNSFGTCSSSWFQCPYGNIWCEICHFMVRPSSLSIHLYLELHNHKWQISRPFSLRKGNKRFIISSPPPPSSLTVCRTTLVMVLCKCRCWAYRATFSVSATYCVAPHSHSSLFSLWSGVSALCPRVEQKPITVLFFIFQLFFWFFSADRWDFNCECYGLFLVFLKSIH